MCIKKTAQRGRGAPGAVKPRDAPQISDAEPHPAEGRTVKRKRRMWGNTMGPGQDLLEHGGKRDQVMPIGANPMKKHDQLARFEAAWRRDARAG